MDDDTIAPFLDALAGTSAYFGPLAHEAVRDRLRRRFIWLWWLSSPHKSLAPKLGTKRLVDGCLWDTHAIGTALYMQNSLGLAFARILIVATRPIDVCDWWQPRSSRSDPLHKYATFQYFEERAYFEGECAPRVIYKMGKCTLIVIEGCRVLRRTWRTEWAPIGAIVDLVVLVFDGMHLNTIVFHATPKYASYELQAYYHFRRALAKITRTGPWIFAFSGGGTRAAIVTHTALRVLALHRIEPRAIAACSGGAWGLSVHAVAGDRPGMTTLIQHGALLDRSSFIMQVAMALVHDVLGNQWETLMHTVPALRRVDFDWSLFVRRLLFGLSPPMSWARLIAQLPKSVEVVAMPTGKLCDVSS